MGFFDNLGSTISEKSKIVADKAKEVADVTKLKMQISTEESKIKEAYLEIGKLFCKKEMGEVPEEFIPYVQIVGDARAQIENLKAQINDLKGVKTCPGCGAEVPLESSFCSACGSKVETSIKPNPVEKAAEEEEKTEE